MMEQLSLDVPEEKNDDAVAGPTGQIIAQELHPESSKITECPNELGESARSVGAGYFPCNREDALLLLGGLFISAQAPDLHVRMPVDDKGIFLFDDLLKASEAKLLSGDREENFPLLLEVAPSVLNRSPRCVAFGDVLCLVFRNDAEADAFRYRPVDEFDPEALPFRVAPLLFGGAGEPRFSLRPDSTNTRRGQLADRIPSGLHFLMCLAEKHPECRKAALPIFSEHVDPAFLKATFSVSQVLMYGLASAREASLPADELVRCFFEFEGYGASQLLEQLQVRFGYKDSSAEEHRTEVKWLEFAADVIHSRLALSGDHLSDEKSIALRAALLALIPETVEQIEVFLEGEKPAGTKVATNAAFLAGLKTGLGRMPWKSKCNQAAQLGELARVIFESTAAGGNMTYEPFVVSSCEADTSTRYMVSAAGHQLVAWDIPKPLERDAIDDFWEKEFARKGFEVIGRGRTRYAWIVRMDGELLVEVQHSSFNDMNYPVLRFVFTEDTKLRKVKEINTSFIGRGHFWYFVDYYGQPALACDLPELPVENIRELLNEQLKEAIKNCVAPKKASKPRVSKKQHAVAT